MKIAITGGTGFIGRKLVESHVASGDQVRVLTRRTPEQAGFSPEVELVHGDLTGNDSIPAAFVDDAEILYHCAAEIRNSLIMREVNVAGTQRLVDAARGRIGRWVQLSSVGAYGRHLQGAITESAPPDPVGEYEWSKATSDEIVTHARQAGAFESVIVRPSVVFGPEMSNLSLFQWIEMIARRLFFFVGKPGASANFIFVDNVVAALRKCGSDSRANGGIYNVSDWRSVESFVGTIAEHLGLPAPWLRLPEAPVRLAARCLERVPRMPLTEKRVVSLCSRATYPCDKLVRELDYCHPVSMEEALARTVRRWHERRSHRSKFKRTST